MTDLGQLHKYHPGEPALHIGVGAIGHIRVMLLVISLDRLDHGHIILIPVCVRHHAHIALAIRAQLVQEHLAHGPESAHKGNIQAEILGAADNRRYRRYHVTLEYAVVGLFAFQVDQLAGDFHSPDLGDLFGNHFDTQLFGQFAGKRYGIPSEFGIAVKERHPGRHAFFLGIFGNVL